MSEEKKPWQSYSFEEAKLRQIEQFILLKLPKISAIEITMADKETLTIKANSEYTDEQLSAEIEKVLQEIKQISKPIRDINYTPGTFSKESVDKALKEYKGSLTFIMGDEMRDEVHRRVVEEIKPPEYTLGIDTYDKENLSYCLGRTIDGVFEVIATKTMRDEAQFKEETENLAKYFNATIVKETK